MLTTLGSIPHKKWMLVKWWWPWLWPMVVALRGPHPVHRHVPLPYHPPLAIARNPIHPAALRYSSRTTATDTTAPRRSTTAVVPLPLSRPWNATTQLQLERALDDLVQSTAYMSPGTVVTDDPWQWTSRVPSFGPDCFVQLRYRAAANDDTGRTPLPYGCLDLSLQQQGDPATAETDLGWMCLKFYESSALLTDLWNVSYALRDRVVVQHGNVAARDTAWTPEQTQVFWQQYDVAAGTNCFFQELLQTRGYVVLDPPPVETDAAGIAWRTTAAQQQVLSDYFSMSRESQSEQQRGGGGRYTNIRTDQIHFVSHEEAQKCDILPQYNLLMGLAHFMNEHASAWNSISTTPLTVPRSLQFAEYGFQDYYIPHSDNALTLETTEHGVPIRCNFRAYTCILYMNDNDWDLSVDGGALRLYFNTQNIYNPLDVLTNASKPYDFVDISPTNGRLLIFDSCLVHSVQPVLSPYKRRRALTLWINRLNSNGVRGEMYEAQ